MLFLDECEVHLHPQLTKVWTFKGKRPEVPAAGWNRRLCVYGALNFAGGQVHYTVHPKKNACQFNGFLRKLLNAKRRRLVVLVLDNASYHKTRETLDILAGHEDHIMVVWLPTYSPELNAIEGLWGYMKKTALNNYFFGTPENLESAIDRAFAALNSDPATALSLAYRTSQNIAESA